MHDKFVQINQWTNSGEVNTHLKLETVFIHSAEILQQCILIGNRMLSHGVLNIV